MRTAVPAVAVLCALVLGCGSVPARAGDNDGRCCAGLEEVVGALTEALTGADRSKRSIRIYGQLNRAVMYWDDGKASSTYAIDNDTSSSRIGVLGKHAFVGDLQAGYRVEIDARVTLSSELSSDDALGDLGDGAIRLRHAYWYVEDAKLGRLAFGQQSPATDDITIISLGAQMSDAALHYNNKFEVRATPQTMPINPAFRVSWEDLAHTVDTTRGLYVRYDTPTFHGWLLSAAGGEEGIWDVALRYSNSTELLKVAGGVGYMEDHGAGIRDLKGSFSMLHTPTGLFATVAGGLREDSAVTVDMPRDGHFYFAQLGIARRFLPLGKTTLYGEYARYNDFSVGRVFSVNLGVNGDRRWLLLDTKVERWGLGMEQEVDSHGLLLYALLHHYDGSFMGQKCVELAGPACTLAPMTDSFSVSPWQAFVVGARIRF
jgi:hypothetical protein